MNIRIGPSQVGENFPCYLIAEAGVNHNGKLELAYQLVDLAVEAGVNAVKFQSFKTESLIINKVEKAPYQKVAGNSEETQFQMLKKLEMSKGQMLQIKKYCIEKNIEFLSTPFDEESLEELSSIGVEAYKIASTDLTNLPFLRKIAAKDLPILLSTGMSYFEEIVLAVREIEKINKQIVILHCTANYPIQDSEVNLAVIRRLKQEFPEYLIGFSDHSCGVGAAPFAIPLGAKVIEKHFTLDKNMKGPDHRASLSPCELKEFVQNVRKAEEYYGTDVKMPTLSEISVRSSLQKCFVARRNIKSGELFSEENTVAKRTGGVGISPVFEGEVFGKAANKDYLKDQVIEL